MDNQSSKKRELISAATALAKADSVIVYAGAGMSADSGLKVFRGSEGVYSGQADEPEARFTPHWLRSSPEEAWRYYWHRIEACLTAIPHEGYASLSKMIEYLSADYFIYTSNVDGLFIKAGFPSTRLLECHGNIFNLQCSRTCRRTVWNLKEHYSSEQLFEFLRNRLPLVCPCCGDVARPNVLMFDDSEWVTRPYWEQQDAYLRWERNNRGKRIVKLEIGAGRGASSVRAESELFPGTLIRLNLDDLRRPNNAIGIRGKAKATLLELEGLVIPGNETPPD